MNLRALLHLLLPLFLLLPKLCFTAPAADNIFFYRASYFPGTPRLAATSLTTLEITAGGGASSHARDACGHLIPLLRWCTALTAEPNNNACHPACGTFSLSEVYYELTQNIAKGFFIDILLPWRSLKATTLCDTQQRSLESFGDYRWAIVVLPPLCQQGLGDTSIYAGWTINYQETYWLDFIDATLKLGVLIPSTHTITTTPIPLPLGNEGHSGIPITFDLAIGAYDWLTVGGHVSALFSQAKNQKIGSLADSASSCCTPVSQCTACVKSGTKWMTAAYIHADHFIRGLSAIIAYSYAKQENSTITNCTVPCSLDNLCFTQAWSMHTLNFKLEYDFARQTSHAGLRLGGFYNLNVGGKRIFTTGVGGGNLGLDACWVF